MLKKTISVLLVLCALSCCLIPAMAEGDPGVISVRLHSDVAGCTYRESANFIEILSDNVILDPERDSPVSISDYAGTVELCPVKAGRTYDVSYMLVAAEGCTLPAVPDDSNVKIEHGKNITVWSVQRVVADKRSENGEWVRHEGLMIRASVVVDSNNFLKRVFGFLYDIYLKIRAWSLY